MGFKIPEKKRYGHKEDEKISSGNIFFTIVAILGRVNLQAHKHNTCKGKFLYIIGGNVN